MTTFQAMVEEMAHYYQMTTKKAEWALMIFNNPDCDIPYHLTLSNHYSQGDILRAVAALDTKGWEDLEETFQVDLSGVWQEQEQAQQERSEQELALIKTIVKRILRNGGSGSDLTAYFEGMSLEAHEIASIVLSVYTAGQIQMSNKFKQAVKELDLF